MSTTRDPGILNDAVLGLGEAVVILDRIRETIQDSGAADMVFVDAILDVCDEVSGLEDYDLLD